MRVLTSQDMTHAIRKETTAVTSDSKDISGDSPSGSRCSTVCADGGNCTVKLHTCTQTEDSSALYKDYLNSIYISIKNCALKI
jgi:hypothetical protein